MNDLFSVFLFVFIVKAFFSSDLRGAFVSTLSILLHKNLSRWHIFNCAECACLWAVTAFLLLRGVPLLYAVSGGVLTYYAAPRLWMGFLLFFEILKKFENYIIKKLEL